MREVRVIRQEIERECGNDAEAFYERLAASQRSGSLRDVLYADSQSVAGRNA